MGIRFFCVEAVIHKSPRDAEEPMAGPLQTGSNVAAPNKPSPQGEAFLPCHGFAKGRIIKKIPAAGRFMEKTQDKRKQS